MSFGTAPNRAISEPKPGRDAPHTSTVTSSRQIRKIPAKYLNRKNSQTHQSTDFKANNNVLSGDLLKSLLFWFKSSASIIPQDSPPATTFFWLFFSAVVVLHVFSFSRFLSRFCTFRISDLRVRPLSRTQGIAHILGKENSFLCEESETQISMEIEQGVVEV